MTICYPWSGQDTCFDASGTVVPCQGSGQDGEYRVGRAWPVPRFDVPADGLVHDRLTGLFWPRKANLAGWPKAYDDAQAFVDQCNRDALLGRVDWRLPRRRELLSLTSLAHARPALPPGHPFVDIFQHWYWTGSASAVAPGHVWRVHLEGGRMFSGQRDAEHLVWPVSGESWLLPESPEEGLRTARPWPHPRFQTSNQEVLDGLTGLVWQERVLPQQDVSSWDEALNAARHMGGPWRLPTIWELESLVDVSRAWPALPLGHPFGIGRNPGEPIGRDASQTAELGLWSSTTSGFEPAWAWVLYVGKGAVGVGHKPGRHFHYLLTRGRTNRFTTCSTSQTLP